jgi:hypothetical protein
MTFFKPSSQKKLKKFLTNHGFEIEQGSKHTKATHASGLQIVYPRHNVVSSGVMHEICKKLEALGIDKSDIEQGLL